VKCLVMSALCAMLCGCAFIEPHTQMSINPITRTVSFFDSKDNDIAIDSISFDATDKSFAMDGLVISNKSSSVIEANVQQMLAFVEQQRAANEGIQNTLAGLTELTNALGVATANLAKAIPAVSVSGSGAGIEGDVVVSPSHP